MRDIKFRALKDDVSNYNWVYGYLIYDVENNPIIQTKDSKNEGTFVTCIKNTEGQFTGLKDKNGVEIYEGDIIEVNSYRNTGDYFGDSEGYHYTIKGVVTYQPSRGFCLKIIKYWDTDNDVNVKGNNRYGYITQYKSKVIGNIHQNKELLNTLDNNKL